VTLGPSSGKALARLLTVHGFTARTLKAAEAATAHCLLLDISFGAFRASSCSVG